MLTTALLSGAMTCSLSGAPGDPAMTIPPGTAIRVRTVDPIDIRSIHPGAEFRGSLADPVVAHHGTVIPRGAAVLLSVVSVKKSTRITGRDKISLQVKSIAFEGRTYPVTTNVVESKGTRKGHRTLKTAGIGAGTGAVVGGIAGGGAGAVVGALVGGGGGTAVAAATGSHDLSIPPETSFSFVLQSAVRLK